MTAFLTAGGPRNLPVESCSSPRRDVCSHSLFFSSTLFLSAFDDFFAFFKCDLCPVSICHPLLRHLPTTINSSTLLTFTQTSCLGVLLSHINTFQGWGGHLWHARCCVRVNNK